MRIRLHAPCFAALLLLGNQAAFAVNTDWISVQQDQCGKTSTLVLVRSVESELRLSIRPEILQRRLHVSITCEEQSFSIEVEDQITGKTLKRREPRPASRSVRLEEQQLVLSIVELIIASWSELLLRQLEPRPPPIVAASSTHPEAPPPQRLDSSQPAIVTPGGSAPNEERQAAAAAVRLRLAPERPTKRRVIALALSRVELAFPRFEYGAGVRYREEHGFIGFGVDFGELHGRQAVSLGHVDIDLIAAGAAITFGHAWTRAQTRLGLGARGGAAVLSGHSSDPSFVGLVYRRPFADVFGSGSIDVALSRRWCVEVSLESGYNVLRVSGLVSTGHEVAVDGAWVGGQVGVGFVL